MNVNQTPIPDFLPFLKILPNPPFSKEGISKELMDNSPLTSLQNCDKVTIKLAQQFGTIIMRWVKLKKYCELSGDTSDAVHAKRRKGAWIDDIHCKIAPDGNLWVNLTEIEKWVEDGNLAILQHSQRE